MSNPVKRIVKMQFKVEETANFINIFLESKPLIRAFRDATMLSCFDIQKTLL